MKKAFLVCMVLFFTQTAIWAQNTPLPSFDNIPGKSNNSAKQDVIVLMYNNDQWLNAEQSYTQKFKSGGISLHLNVLQQQLGNSRFSISEGIGFSSRNYFNNVLNYTKGDMLTNGLSTFGADTIFVKNKINITTIEVPLEIRYTSSPNAKNRSFKVALGGTIGYVVGAKVKRENESGEIVKIRNSEDLRQLNDLRLGLHARIGYHRLGLHAYYGINNWFNDQGKQGTPFSLGLSVLMF